MGDRLTVSVIAALAAASFPVPAQTAAWLAIGPQAGATLLASLPAGSGCFQYTYDRNGNRIASSTASVISGGMVWGSATFGCAIWGV
ncbi:hypothetical protein [Erythrobacter sp. JK5]|uniref:hypothetical protein n=1 Tax=Erythrobacter sp. JK5 TaxID=2829500 RepID=UPI001BABD7F4|nr:hypothetical protein [Erythrobacter sp. JK5]QUL36898.1 hypothetical protein KDC96_10820 [Erythrobacter sp. JK5]